MKARIEGGKIVHPLSTLWRWTLGRFEGKEVDIQIERWSPKRTDQQNRYYFGVVCPFVADGIYDLTGERYSKDAVHEWLRKRFLPESEIVDITTGEVLKVPSSTKRLSVEEFASYLNDINSFSLEHFGSSLPPAE